MTSDVHGLNAKHPTHAMFHLCRSSGRVSLLCLGSGALLSIKAQLHVCAQVYIFVANVMVSCWYQFGKSLVTVSYRFICNCYSSYRLGSDERCKQQALAKEELIPNIFPQLHYFTALLCHLDINYSAGLCHQRQVCRSSRASEPGLPQHHNACGMVDGGDMGAYAGFGSCSHSFCYAQHPALLPRSYQLVHGNSG
jgi:hypothetical protein